MIRVSIKKSQNLIQTLWFVLIFLSFAFLQVTHAQNDDSAEKIRIDPSAAMGGTVSEYIDKVQFIPLESTTTSAFGNIDQLEVTDKFFIILDRETNAILIFNKQGQYHAKIEIKKLRKDFSFHHFCLQKDANLIEIPNLPHNYYFDLDAKQVIKNEFYAFYKINLGSKYAAYYDYDTYMDNLKDSTAYELKVFEEGKLKQNYFAYSKKNVTMESGDILSSNHINFYPDYSGNDSTVYYLRTYNYNIYRLTPHTLQAVYQFIFPLQNSLPKNFTTDPSLNKKRIKYIMSSMNVISNLSNFYKKSNSIFLKAGSSYIYNTESKNLICISKIVSDSSSYFLPITDAEVGGVDFSNHGMINFDGNYFYTSYSSLVLFNQMEATKSKKTQYPSILSAYLSDEKNRKGNPVLVQIQFKNKM